MTPSIRPLPDDVVRQIAAGEVIASPAAAVRELVENAIDAGATRASVAIDARCGHLQVADNGAGMSVENLKVCALPHSTSKIGCRDDLRQIASLGFRGEALHSLARLADLTIASRTMAPTEVPGWEARYNLQGEPRHLETRGMAPGTIITVANLFANYPARSQALPPPERQLKAIQQAIYHVALCHPQLTWQVSRDGRVWFNLFPGSSARDILPQVLLRVRTTDLRSIQHAVETPGHSNRPSHLEVTVGLPDRCHRSRPDWIKVALNGRHVSLPELEQAIYGIFARTLPRDRYPVCWLHLKTCPSLIDWNRHPAKCEVYLQALDYWQAKASEAIAAALQLDTADAGDGNGRVKSLLSVSEARGSYRLADSRDRAAASEFSLLALKAIGQASNTYIVVEHPAGIWLVEQHIAHERVLYECLQADWQLVPQEPPIILEGLTPKQRECLQHIGIEIDAFGDNLWAARNIPALLQGREDAREAILELAGGGDLQAAQVATACRSAIRNGTPLSVRQMQELLDAWKVTRNPRTCPHGRPIYLALEETSLSRFFRRHWVIGKSHGI